MLWSCSTTWQPLLRNQAQGNYWGLCSVEPKPWLYGLVSETQLQAYLPDDAFMLALAPGTGQMNSHSCSSCPGSSCQLVQPHREILGV